MGITVEWDNPEQTIIRFTYDETWTWDDFHNSIRQGNIMMDSVPHRVISIVDMSGTNHVPPNAFVHIKRVVEESQKHNNTNISIFVDAEHFTRVIIDTTSRLYPNVRTGATFHYAKNLDEARVLAEKLRLEGEPDT